MGKPRVLVFESASLGDQPSFPRLIRDTEGPEPTLEATVVGVVSDRAELIEDAADFGVRFSHWPGPFEPQRYRRVMSSFGVEWVVFLNWQHEIRGLDPNHTLVVHPGPLPLTRGMHGDRIHDAVLVAFRKKWLKSSGIAIGFMEANGDVSVAYRQEVEILPTDTVEKMKEKTKACLEECQGRILNLIFRRDILLVGDGMRYSGKAASLTPYRRGSLRI